MTETFPIDCYRDGIAEVAETVFSTMLNIAIEAADPPATLGPSELTAAVYYAGAWKGAVLLECSMTQAAAWASRLMGLPPPVPPEYARDAIGELCNILAGNLKPLLPPGIGVSTPSVVRGSDYTLKICGDTRIERLDFTEPLGPFRVTLIAG